MAAQALSESGGGAWLAKRQHALMPCVRVVEGRGGDEGVSRDVFSKLLGVISVISKRQGPRKFQGSEMKLAGALNE